MRLAALALALLIGLPAGAQDAPKKKGKQLTHKKPTPEQIRKFNALQKKHKQ